VRKEQREKSRPEKRGGCWTVGTAYFLYSWQQLLDLERGRGGREGEGPVGNKKKKGGETGRLIVSGVFPYYTRRQSWLIGPRKGNGKKKREKKERGGKGDCWRRKEGGGPKIWTAFLVSLRNSDSIWNTCSSPFAMKRGKGGKEERRSRGGRKRKKRGEEKEIAGFPRRFSLGLTASSSVVVDRERERGKKKEKKKGGKKGGEALRRKGGGGIVPIYVLLAYCRAGGRERGREKREGFLFPGSCCATISPQNPEGVHEYNEVRPGGKRGKKKRKKKSLRKGKKRGEGGGVADAG